MKKHFTSISLIGSTSSGKSTLGNLLAGRRVFPSGVQETTTSVADVIHQKMLNQRSSIFMTNLSDKQSDGVQTIQFESDTEVMSQLNMLMSLNSASNIHLKIQLSMNAKPKLGKKWMRYYFHNMYLQRKKLLDELEILDGFFIRDFPGFQHESDNNRLTLLENYLDRDGLILFVFNAEETDDIKENKLLDRLFDVLHRQNRNWQSVIFLLNRMDAFYRDIDPNVNLINALTARKQSIRKLIYEKWKKTITDSELTIIPVAAGLALSTELLCWQTDSTTESECQNLKEHVADYGLCLLPDELTNTLSRDVNKWYFKQWLQVYNAMYFSSGIHALAEKLKFG
ncbi:MAG: dynamin family protein [Nitrosomonas sp.]